jgi:hypothetical protein
MIRSVCHLVSVRRRQSVETPSMLPSIESLPEEQSSQERIWKLVLGSGTWVVCHFALLARFDLPCELIGKGKDTTRGCIELIRKWASNKDQHHVELIKSWAFVSGSLWSAHPSAYSVGQFARPVVIWALPNHFNFCPHYTGGRVAHSKIPW